MRALSKIATTLHVVTLKSNAPLSSGGWKMKSIYLMSRIVNFEAGPKLVARKNSADQHEPNIYGKFFDLTSSARFTVREESVVNVLDLIDQKKTLQWYPLILVRMVALWFLGWEESGYHVRSLSPLTSTSRVLFQREKWEATNCGKVSAGEFFEVVNAVRVSDSSSTVTLDTAPVSVLIRQGLRMAQRKGYSS
ncbi:alcohol dehydrogenase [Penicillium angulare]|uniref:Alcohol dehydrogenase n=1 Tax=Penicillium angulare TaxID=116970 RepID=A0A9W9JVW0_9EURO|nr:alcohol dehydrogenase [Penicillium angulare]